MKNLIITAGILLLMTVGILYDLDCRDLVSAERRVKWACEDAAYGAAAVLAAEGTADEAEAAAAEILQRNLKLGADMRPVDEDAFFEGPVTWQMEFDGQHIRLEADCGRGKPRLAFLQDYIRIKTEVYFTL